MKSYSKRWLLLSLAALLLITIASLAWAHGEGVRIVPKTLIVKAGKPLPVDVEGLEGVDKAHFTLTGLFGKIDLGTFPIAQDDFHQVLDIPADTSPGSYRLEVEGGANRAEIVITVN